VIYRYDLGGEFAPTMTLTSPRGAVRSFAYSANDAGFFSNSTVIFKHGLTTEIEIPIAFENVGSSAVVSTSGFSNLGSNYSATVSNRWRYDPLKKRLLAPALAIGTNETVYVRVNADGKDWSFEALQVQYDAGQTVETALVEFYNTTLGHFFVTLEGAEAKGIDQGLAGPGWMRTGYSWGAWKDAASAPSGAVPVCRFYGNPAVNSSGKRLGPNSHFYTIDATECARVAKDPGWILETKAAFYAQATDPVNFFCPGDTFGVRRWYNNGYPTKDSNHRFSSQYTSAMESIKWTDEGVRFCLARSP
jgi:Repeat of unknown function (DUF5648)